MNRVVQAVGLSLFLQNFRKVRSLARRTIELIFKEQKMYFTQMPSENWVAVTFQTKNHLFIFTFFKNKEEFIYKLLR